LDQKYYKALREWSRISRYQRYKGFVDIKDIKDHDLGKTDRNFSGRTRTFLTLGVETINVWGLRPFNIRG
jgi:hypothetical protein